MCTKYFPSEPVFKAHGGVKAVAEALGYDYQRVHNWKRRGIPALEIALRPDFFVEATRHVVTGRAA